ncbi:alanine racemase [Virgibacillus sp. C22-A2]|uniref:Alanine racemase n=1 Tax=Virgibacillus tibetensis TaxID=3042313 RepID=A0ABU6KHX9_9BACI|nr:alanine racemase [Virgibacillus sp. C22-A2]
MTNTNTFYRDTWAEIDLDAIEYNINQIKEKLPEKTTVVAVVKANAYGHGSIQVAKKALESGAEALAVALLEEALDLREASITAPILVLGRVPASAAAVAADNDIALTFFQKEWLEEVNSLPLTSKLKLHMKWDTGMGRVGIRTPEELKDILHALNENQSIYLTGVYTHFATADEADMTYFYKQKKRFEDMLFLFKELWPHKVAVHIGNSASAIRLPNEMYDCVRFGISMYGLYPSGAVKEGKEILLKQAFSLHSRLIHIKKVPAGESISYGSTYVTEEDEWIGTILIGYGDGWIRKFQGSSVLVDGKRMPIVGRICMDQTMIRLDKKYLVGTKVTLIGEQDNARIEMDEIADYVETINYEIPCIINQRVPRVYRAT